MNSLVDTNSMSSSFCELQEIPQSQKVVGQRICNKMENMIAGAIALKKIAEVTTEHGSRTATAGITIAAGISMIYTGDWVVGSTATLVGLKEAFNIWQKVNSTTDIGSLLNDASAGVDMIKTLEEANAQSFKVVNTNLSIISKKVKRMNDQFEKIKAISHEGQKELEIIKEEASGLYEEAQEEFDNAKASFKLSQKRFTQANEIFIKTAADFNELFELAKTTDISDAKKLDAFVEKARRIQRKCAAAQKLIKTGNEFINSGIESLDTARDKEMAAKEKTLVAMERAKVKMAVIEAQAKVKREYEQKVEETREEVNHIQERNKDIRSLLNELTKDLKEAKKLSDDKFGTMSVILGVIPGTVAGFSAGGFTGAVVGGLAGGAVVHNRNSLVGKIDNLINGPATLIDANPNKAELVKLKFSSRSSGWFNRFIKKTDQSYTVGMVDIQIGKEIVSLPFNLNRDYKISKPDLYNLQQKLGKKVIDGEISAQECLTILTDLEQKFINRGASNKVQTGLIASNNPYFAELKRACAQIIVQEQRSDEEIIAEAIESE